MQVEKTVLRSMQNAEAWKLDHLDLNNRTAVYKEPYLYIYIIDDKLYYKVYELL